MTGSLLAKSPFFLCSVRTQGRFCAGKKNLGKTKYEDIKGLGFKVRSWRKVFPWEVFTLFMESTAQAVHNPCFYVFFSFGWWEMCVYVRESSTVAQCHPRPNAPTTNNWFISISKGEETSLLFFTRPWKTFLPQMDAGGGGGHVVFLFPIVAFSPCGKCDVGFFSQFSSLGMRHIADVFFWIGNQRASFVFGALHVFESPWNIPDTLLRGGDPCDTNEKGEGGGKPRKRSVSQEKRVIGTREAGGRVCNKRSHRKICPLYYYAVLTSRYCSANTVGVNQKAKSTI